jgi:hypothetical protein
LADLLWDGGHTDRPKGLSWPNNAIRSGTGWSARIAQMSY